MTTGHFKLGAERDKERALDGETLRQGQEAITEVQREVTGPYQAMAEGPRRGGGRGGAT